MGILHGWRLSGSEERPDSNVEIFNLVLGFYSWERRNLQFWSRNGKSRAEKLTLLLALEIDEVENLNE